jgi:filamentous hemagglutinin family protein
VVGNPNLSEGGSAKIILNEVVAGKMSNIAGFLGYDVLVWIETLI